ncbi:MAG: heterodisulfide reductase-related iron-sulfur binding cluster [Anaerolineae bacterium]|jgi:heterodisulfide reductase subunit B
MTEAITTTDTSLARLIEEETGENVYLCYQCVKCTSGCPLAEHFDYTPNEILRALQLGLDEILFSRTIWLCASCQVCTTRCPQGIDIAKIMDHLMMLTRERGIQPAIPAVESFLKVFHRNAKLLGRAYEAGLVVETNLRALDPLKDVFDLGLPMILKGKIKFLPSVARVPKRVQRRELTANQIGYYPGCSLHSMAIEFQMSTEAAAEVLGLELVEPKGWTCCGSSPAHKLDPDDALTMPLANLSLFERSGFDQVAVPCAACFSRFRAAQHEIRENSSLRRRLEKAIGQEVHDTVEVRSLVDVMAERVGLEAIAAKVQKPLEGLKVVAYYGCLLTRPPKIAGVPHPEYPLNMDRVLDALGAEALDWDGKTRCCGAGLAATVPERALELCRWLIDQARAVGADCIAVACPLCHANLDGRQLQMDDLEETMPILYFTQLMALAFGVEAKAAGLNKNLVDPVPLLREKGIDVLR